MISNQSLRVLLAAENLGFVQSVKTLLRETPLKYELIFHTGFLDSLHSLSQQHFDIFLIDAATPDTADGNARSLMLQRLPEVVTKVPTLCFTAPRDAAVQTQLTKIGAHELLFKGQFDGNLLQKSMLFAQKQFDTQAKLNALHQQMAKSRKQVTENEQLTATGSWQIDLVTNEMMWSDQLYRMLNFMPGSISASVATYLRYVHRDDYLSVESFFEEVAKDGKNKTLQHRIVLDGASVHHFCLSAKVYFDESTAKLVMIGTVQNILPLKLQEQLAQDKKNSMQAEKLKETLQIAFSRRLYEPLMHLSQSVSLLEQYKKEAVIKNQLPQLKSTLEQLAQLNNEFSNEALLAQKNVSIDSEVFDSQEFINNIVQFSRLKCAKFGLALQTELSDNIPEKLIGDVRYLSLSLHNLTEEAIALAAVEGGKMTLRITVCESSEADIKLSFVFKFKGKTLPIAQLKAMNGAEKHLEAYVNQGNSGLKNGYLLGIAARLTRLSGGTLTVQNKESGTTQFTLIAPLRLPVPSAAPANILTNSSRGLRLLLAEDHFLNQIALKKIISEWSERVTVDVAENGLICVEKSRANPYDLILMDLQMPIMNGLKAAERIRQRSDIPIIALGAHISPDEKEKCHTLGIHQYLSKPFKADDLQRAILGALAQEAVTSRA